MKNKRFRMLQMILALVFCISAGILCKELVWNRLQNEKEAEKLKTEFLLKNRETEEDTSKDNAEESEKTPVPLVDLEGLQTQYPDIQAWLTIPDTLMDYPVLRSSDDSYYLRRNYKKEWDINGSLFFQSNCDLEEGKNLIIYGHNMNSGVQFGNLDLYTDPDYERTHHRIYLQTGQHEVRVYRIAAVLKADISMFPFQKVQFPEDHSAADYVEKAREQALYPIEKETEEEPDQILTLVTCAYEWREARLILVAVRES